MEQEPFKVQVEEVPKRKRPSLNNLPSHPLIDEAVRRRLRERYVVPTAAFMSSI